MFGALQGAAETSTLVTHFLPRLEDQTMQDFTIFLNHHVTLAIAALVVVFLLFIIETLRLKSKHYCINTAQAIQLINRENAVVIDIRAPEAYQAGHIADAHNLQQDDLKAPFKKLDRHKTKPLVVVCNTGVSSQKVTAELLAAGFKAHSLNGGMRAWTDAGIPTIKG